MRVTHGSGGRCERERTVKAECEIVDAKSGKVLARFEQERRSGVGMMGGDYQELMQRNLNAIGEDTANLLKSF